MADYRKRKPKKKQYPKLVVLLAKAQHKIWSAWTSYVISQCEKQERPILDFDSTEGQKNENHLDDMPTMKGKETLLVIPADLVADAQQLIDTPWEKLSREQQEAFHEEVATILEALREYGSDLIASMLPEKENDDG
jgi:hypothetical protein